MKRYAPGELLGQGKTIITAHSACEGTLPNSREHIRAAIESGAEMIEVDVRRAPDGHLYLAHDVPQDISACPTLDELFEQVAPQENLCMNLDVKTEGLIEDVMTLAARFDLQQRIVFTGACNADRALANALGGEMWRSVWDKALLNAGIADNRADGSPLLNVYFGMISEEAERELRADGGTFSAWTVDREADIRRFLQMGIGNITTRQPVLAMRLRREIQGI